MARKSKKSKQPAHLARSGQQQFSANDEAIRRALRRIEADPTLPATQDTVAELAGCSRSTFNNRAVGIGPDGKEVKDPLGFHGWLKRIKEARRKSAPARKVTPEDDLKAEIEALKRKVEAARRESKRQFDKRVETERKYDKLAKRYALQADLLTELNAKLASMGAGTGSVVMLRPGGQS